MTRSNKVCIVFALLAAGAYSSRANAQGPPFREYENRRELREEKRADKLATLNRVSTWYLRAGTAFDGVTTIRGLERPAVARREDGTFLMRYPGRETGWARCFGERNTGAVVAANAGLNLGVEWLSRRIYRKGGNWRYLAIGLRLWKATDSVVAGVGNLRYNAGINERIRANTGYPGRIVWTRH